VQTDIESQTLVSCLSMIHILYDQLIVYFFFLLQSYSANRARGCVAKGSFDF
jgi:hypothetical protein